MPASTSPIFPNVPIIGIANVSGQTPVTARTPITGTTGLVQLTATSTNGTRVDAITVKATGNSTAGLLDVWIYNGTTSFLFDEIAYATVTANTTTVSNVATTTYATLTLPPTYQLFVSQQVTSNCAVFAFGGQY
jgi:hypothetical protein